MSVKLSTSVNIKYVISDASVKFDWRLIGKAVRPTVYSPEQVNHMHSATVTPEHYRWEYFAVSEG
jgi:hypothetical protein